MSFLMWAGVQWGPGLSWEVGGRTVGQIPALHCGPEGRASLCPGRPQGLGDSVSEAGALFARPVLSGLSTWQGEDHRNPVSPFPLCIWAVGEAWCGGWLKSCHCLFWGEPRGWDGEGR